MRAPITRRHFVVGAGATSLGLLAGCGRWPWQAQPPTKLPRVGYLSTISLSVSPDRLESFRQGLRELGYVEGRNIEIEVRSAEGESERLPDLAAELVRLPVKVIVTGDGPGTQAAQQATGTTPIVMAAGGDPIEAGFVGSLARPGGNITGLSSMAPRLVGKQLEFLKETVPGVSRVAVLNPAYLSHPSQLREVEASAAVLRVRLQPVEVHGPDELDGAFMTMTGEQADGLIVPPNPILLAHRARVVSLAAESRLPAVYGLRDFVQAGGLMSYAANRSEMYRRSAYYVDRILKGTSPADLPVEQPMTFDFVVNLKTARELGITFPHEILLQVTEVIQ